MGAVNFYLKKAEPVSGNSLIYLQFKYNGKKLVFSFGQTINPKDWNNKKQRVKSNTQTTADGNHALNDLLDTLETLCLQGYKSELKNGIPSREAVKQHLIDFLNQNGEATGGPTLYSLIDRFIKNEIKYKGQDKSSNTIKTYGTTLKHLKAYEKAKKYPVNFNSINLDFYYSFVDYLKGQGLNLNSIGKEVKNLKAFMSEAVDLGYTNNMKFKQKKFSVTSEETDSVYLTEMEIMKFYKHDFSKSKRLEQVRDLFVFGCFVGLRFSDYSNVKRENIVQSDGEQFIRMKTQKTKEEVYIPCNPVVLEIFDKYQGNKNRLPNAPSNQKFNDYLKEAAEDAGLTETGRLSTDHTLELWQCLSSHTARRSFATNYYLQGFPVYDLMKITGHRTERSFLRYIRITKLDTAKRLSKHIKKNWSEMLLRVAG